VTGSGALPWPVLRAACPTPGPSSPPQCRREATHAPAPSRSRTPIAHRVLARAVPAATAPGGAAIVVHISRPRSLHAAIERPRRNAPHSPSRMQWPAAPLPLEGKGSPWASPDDALWQWLGGEGGEDMRWGAARSLLVARGSFRFFTSDFHLPFTFLVLEE
jgi:hypothetical protein